MFACALRGAVRLGAWNGFSAHSFVSGRLVAGETGHCQDRGGLVISLQQNVLRLTEMFSLTLPGQGSLLSGCGLRFRTHSHSVVVRLQPLITELTDCSFREHTAPF